MRNTKTKIFAVATLGLFSVNLTFADIATPAVTGTGTPTTITTPIAVATPTITSTEQKEEFLIKSANLIDSKNVSVKVSENIKNISEASIINIFENTNITSTTPDTTNTNVINIVLEQNIIAGTLYNLISNVDEVQVNGDFSYNGEKIELLPNAKGIKEIKLLEPNKIEVTLESAPSKIDLTVLKDLAIEKFAFENGSLNILLKETFKKATKYILLSTLLDNTGKEIPVTNFVYDFTSPAELTEVATPALDTITTETPALDAVVEEAKPIEEVAMAAETTPATGASTNVLILLTLLTSSALFIRNKKSA